MKTLTDYVKRVAARFDEHKKDIASLQVRSRGIPQFRNLPLKPKPL